MPCRLNGIVLHEYKNMLALGKKLGFEIKRDPDSGDNELAIHFGGNRPWCELKKSKTYFRGPPIYRNPF